MDLMFAHPGLSPLAVCATVIAVGVAGALVPFIPVEPLLIGAATVTTPLQQLVLVLLVTASQMAAKFALCTGSARAGRTMSPRMLAMQARMRVRLDVHPRLQSLTVWTSALVGLPPLFAVSVAWGALRLPRRRFMIAGAIGRAMRFSILMIVPQLLFALVLLVCAAPAASAQAPARDSARGVVWTLGRSGGARTYVLMTGMVGGVEGFRRLAERLAQRGNRVIVVDPYRLSLDSADASFSAMARRVDAVLARYDVHGADFVGHAHGAGVMLRLVAMAPDRAARLYFLDVGALASNQTTTFSAMLSLVPLIARLPGGRTFIRGRIVDGLLANSVSREWLDARTLRAYTEPMLDNLSRTIAMARRLAVAREPESVADLVRRIRLPVVVLLGEVRTAAGPGEAELVALAPLSPRIVRVAGAGHFLHEEAPDAVADIITRAAAVAIVDGRGR